MPLKRHFCRKKQECCKIDDFVSIYLPARLLTSVPDRLQEIVFPTHASIEPTVDKPGMIIAFSFHPARFCR
jgi:hypothetical protein